MDKEARFSDCLKNAFSENMFPGCSFIYLSPLEEIVLSYGTTTHTEIDRPITSHTLYDVASLTKIIATMTLAQVLIDEGVLSLNDTVGTYLPEYATTSEKMAVTILHLMTYTVDYNIPGGSKSLLPTLSPAHIANNVLSCPLTSFPGTRYLYSNITAFILTQVIEKASGHSFYDLVQEKILVPLKMSTATFSPSKDILESIPPAEVTAERGEVRGVVHDEFTYYTHRGGVANGAAGLFASILDIKNFLDMTLNGGVFSGKRFLSEEIVSTWTQDLFPELLPTHTPLAWGDLNNTLIDSFHRTIVVKGGFTGCFLLADLKQKRAFGLLSNRTYPTRSTDSSDFLKLKNDLATIALEN